MKCTYQATFRMRRDGVSSTLTQFFSGRGQKESPKAEAEAESWIRNLLQQHGAYDCDCTIARVVYHIKG